MPSGGEDGTLRLWSLPLGRQEIGRRAHRGGVTCLAVSPDARWCVSSGRRGQIKLWALRDLLLLRTIDLDGVPASSIAFSPDAHRLLAASENSGLLIWDLQHPAPPIRYEPDHSCLCATGLPDGRKFLRGDSGGAVLWRESVSGSAATLLEMVSPVTSLAVLPSGTEVLTAAGFVYRVAFSPDGLLALSAAWNGELKLWDTATREPLVNFAGHSGLVLDAAFSPNGRQVVSTGADGTVRLEDVASGKELRRFQLAGPAAPSSEAGQLPPDIAAPFARCAVFSPDGKLVAAGQGMLLQPGTAPKPAQAPPLSRLWVWQTATGRKLTNVAAHARGVRALAFSPDGGKLLSGGGDGRLILWDARTWNPIRRFHSEASRIDSVAFSPDGARFVSGGAPHELRLWDARTGQLVRTFDKIDQEVVSVSIFGPRGERIIMAGAGHGLELRDFTRAEREGVSPINFARPSLSGASLFSKSSVLQIPGLC